MKHLHSFTTNVFTAEGALKAETQRVMYPPNSDDLHQRNSMSNEKATHQINASSEIYVVFLYKCKVLPSGERVADASCFHWRIQRIHICFILFFFLILIFW